MSRPELRFVVIAVVICTALATLASDDKIRPMTGAESPGALLGDLQTAVSTRDRHLWADCLSDSFCFVPYAGVVQTYPELKWQDWGLARELKFVEYLLSPARKADLNLLNDVVEMGIQSGGRSEWDLIYTLILDGTTFRGRALLGFVEIRGLWYLDYWVDTRQELVGGSLAPTSGDARASLTR